MFRRLLTSFGLLLAGLFVALALAVPLVVGPGAEWGQFLGLLAIVLVVGLAGVVALSARLGRRNARALARLVRGAEKMGTGGRAFRAVEGPLRPLGEALERTDERLVERIRRLEQERQQLRAILSGMIEGVVALDPDQRLLFANDRAASLLDLPSPPPVGRPLWEVVRQRALLDAVRRALDGPEPHREEINWRGKASRCLTVHVARLPGEPAQGAVMVLHDTSDLRRLERLRQEFVANVSHELKTPLAVIKANVETLVDGAVDDAENRGRFLDQIARQSDRLHALILDLLSLARIESGDEQFDFKPVPLAPLVQSCLERHRPRAEGRRQQLLLAPDAPAASVWADEEAVDQVLDNLLDNALKYTPEGGSVRVTWAVTGEEAVLEVADTGIGIPEADLPRVFERFYRVDRARSREMGGTGLGLSIVKHLVQAMKGTVRATSTLGEGTTFSVCLPMAGRHAR
jgi:two-component system phosphate regulon sensor histidine kinase PhoR